MVEIKNVKLKMVTIVLVLLTTFVSQLYAHLCHDPFRPQEQIYVLPEKELIELEDKGEFRIYVENTFSTTIRDVELIVENPAFDIKIVPPIIKKLVPGERTFFLVKLNLKKNFKPGNYPLSIDIKACSAEIVPTTRKVNISVDKKVPQQIQQEKLEIQQPATEEKVLPKIKDEPEKEVSPVKTSAEYRESKTTDEIKRPQETFKEQDRKIEEPKREITVKVEKIPFFRKPVFYVVLILSLFFIFLIRKLK